MSRLTTLLTTAANCLTILIYALCCASTGAAQTRPAQPPRLPPATAAPAPSPSAVTAARAEPDLSITANVTARVAV